MKNLIRTAAAALVLLFSSCAGNVDLNGKWEIVSVGGETVEATETNPYLEFNTADGKVHGHTGCNLMNGKFTLDGKKLSFSDMATTMMAGPDMDLERSVLDAINSTASVKKASKDMVEVFDADGNQLMELRKK